MIVQCLLCLTFLWWRFTCFVHGRLCISESVSFWTHCNGKHKRSSQCLLDQISEVKGKASFKVETDLMVFTNLFFSPDVTLGRKRLIFEPFIYYNSERVSNIYTLLSKIAVITSNSSERNQMGLEIERRSFPFCVLVLSFQQLWLQTLERTASFSQKFPLSNDSPTKVLRRSRPKLNNKGKQRYWMLRPHRSLDTERS